MARWKEMLALYLKNIPEIIAILGKLRKAVPTHCS
jgi:hypothetical protein